MKTNAELLERLKIVKKKIRRYEEEALDLQAMIQEGCSHPREWLNIELVPREDDYGAYLPSDEVHIKCKLCNKEALVPRVYKETFNRGDYYKALG